MSDLAEHLRTTLTKRRLPAATELALQDAIALAFTAAGIAFEREVHLSAEDRVDFMVEGNVGVEVKIAGGLSEVTRQLHRYAQHNHRRFHEPQNGNYRRQHRRSSRGPRHQ